MGTIAVCTIGIICTIWAQIKTHCGKIIWHGSLPQAKTVNLILHHLNQMVAMVVIVVVITDFLIKV